MSFYKSSTIALSVFVLSACATTPGGNDPAKTLGILWAIHSAEYRAITTEIYRDATDDLPGFIEDRTWNVLTGAGEPATLPPAVILDVDETVISNAVFQLNHEHPFTDEKLDTWDRHHKALAVPGVVAFVNAARASGVAVFFVTNRPCVKKAGNDDPCPQKTTTIDGIHEIGLAVDAEHVMLAGERPGWIKEKSSRQMLIAKTHRVIMLIGDDLGDFAPCVRAKPHGSCTTAATRASRKAVVEKHTKLWGNGWYILPNPMHGSWTSVE